MFRRRKKGSGEVAQTRNLAPILDTYTIDASVLTDVGCVREANEDSSLFYLPSDEVERSCNAD